MPLKNRTVSKRKYMLLTTLTLISVLLITAGCAKTTINNSCCAVLKPIYAASKDTLGTKRQILANNIKRDYICRQ